MSEIGSIIKNMKTTYGKKVMIVETAFPWTSQGADAYSNIIANSDGATGYGVSKEEHLRYMKDLTQTVISAGGVGVQYWEPAWITSSMKDRWGKGSSWENNAYFDFTGNTISVIDWMSVEYQF
jgi:arabinogalactan endo-1,4-beta-galactosidase